MRRERPRRWSAFSRQEKIYADAYQTLAKTLADELGTTQREKTLLVQLEQDEAAAQPALRKATQLGFVE